MTVDLYDEEWCASLLATSIGRSLRASTFTARVCFLRAAGRSVMAVDSGGVAAAVSGDVVAAASVGVRNGGRCCDVTAAVDAPPPSPPPPSSGAA